MVGVHDADLRDDRAAGISSIFGIEGFKATLLAWGFLYLFLAMLMGPTRRRRTWTRAARGKPGVWRRMAVARGQPPPFAAARLAGGEARRRIRRRDRRTRTGSGWTWRGWITGWTASTGESGGWRAL